MILNPKAPKQVLMWYATKQNIIPNCAI